jgi:hypothetical protein
MLKYDIFVSALSIAADFFAIDQNIKGFLTGKTECGPHTQQLWFGSAIDCVAGVQAQRTIKIDQKSC